MIQVSHYTFDPTGLDVSGVTGGRAERGDVFADIFGQNFEVVSQESNPSVRQRPKRVNEQQVSETENAPAVVTEDQKDIKDISETDSETTNDQGAAVDPEAIDQPGDSREAVGDEGEVVEENVTGQTTMVTAENVVLLEQLASDIKAQHSPPLPW